MKPAHGSARSWLVGTSISFPIRFPPLMWIQLAPLCAVLISVMGCTGGDGLDRKGVSGKVTVDAKAVPDGSINFTPLGGSGISGGAPISNGTYSIAQNEGLTPGKYLVTISGNDGSASLASADKMPGDEEFVPPKSLVPPEWNDEKHEVEVGKGAGSFVFDFDIKSKE